MAAKRVGALPLSARCGRRSARLPILRCRHRAGTYWSDMTAPRALKSSDLVRGADVSIPAMPVPAEEEMRSWGFLLIRDRRPSIGWQHRPEATGGSCLLVAREPFTVG